DELLFRRAARQLEQPDTLGASRTNLVLGHQLLLSSVRLHRLGLYLVLHPGGPHLSARCLTGCSSGFITATDFGFVLPCPSFLFRHCFSPCTLVGAGVEPYRVSLRSKVGKYRCTIQRCKLQSRGQQFSLTKIVDQLAEASMSTQEYDNGPSNTGRFRRRRRSREILITQSASHSRTCTSREVAWPSYRRWRETRLAFPPERTRCRRCFDRKI